MQAMEIGSSENNEINLYDDLLKFNEMSPEERVSVARTSLTEAQSAATSPESAEPAEAATNQSPSFNVRVSGPLDNASFDVPAAESNDMIFTLSDETQSPDSAASDQIGEFLLSYQSQPSLDSAKQQDFSGFDEAPEVIQQADITEKTEEVTALADEEPFGDQVETSEPVAQALGAELQEPDDSTQVSEPVAAEAIKENVIKATQPPAPRVTDKQGVRITVREETAGSVTLSVADIMGDDDFEDEFDEITETTSRPHLSEIVDPAPAETTGIQPATASQEYDPPVASNPLEITGLLVDTTIDSPGGEEVLTVAESQPRNEQTEPSTDFAEEAAISDLLHSRSSTDQAVRDSGRLEDFLKGSKPLKITGFLDLEGKSDNADEPAEITCPTCGHISKSTDMVCLGCGAFFDDQDVEVESKYTCADCGETVAADEVFCPACGSILLAH